MEKNRNIYQEVYSEYKDAGELRVDDVQRVITFREVQDTDYIEVETGLSDGKPYKDASIVIWRYREETEEEYKAREE
jgi:hypothetical protein